MDHLHERLERLEQRTRTVKHQPRWWRGPAFGLVVLAVLTWALPSGTAWTRGWVAPVFAEQVFMAQTRHRDAPCPASKFLASGQTTAFQADINDGISGNFVDVPDDGTLEAGATLRYRDNGDGTITDRRTKLMWEKKGDDGGLHDKDNSYTWSDDGSGSETIWDWLQEINAENGTGFAGHDDWRIPNVRELQSMVDYGQYNPAVDPVFNTNCTPGVDVVQGSCQLANNGWTSTTSAGFPDLAWLVNFITGEVYDTNGAKVNGTFVRAVRGGCQ
jgi:hypothetical protein